MKDYQKAYSNEIDRRKKGLHEDIETISPSPMYAYLVTSDMTGMTFAMIHKDKERVTNQTGQRMS